ncbi:MAG: hypothetical protein ACTSRW_10625 [Candidatus Helarchaeota archaeon]
MDFQRKEVVIPWENNKKVKMDEWVEDVLKIHFHPTDGTPFWLEWQKKNDVDVLKEIKCVSDLFNVFTKPVDEEPLKTRPVEDFYPKKINGNPVQKQDILVFESGGATGLAKRVPWLKKIFAENMDYYSWSLDKQGFPKDVNYTYFGPSGPHYFGYSARWNAEKRNGLFFLVDMDTRFIRMVSAEQKMDMLAKYMENFQRQAQPILQSQNIGILVTTAVILSRMAEELPIDKMNISGTIHAGVAITTDEQASLMEIYGVNNRPFVGIYGNTMYGGCFQRPPKNPKDMVYYPQLPWTILWLGQPDNLSEQVKYGEKGRVCFTRIEPAFFWPFMVERDEAIRERGDPDFCNWDGVAEVGVFSELKSKITTGVY